MSTPNTGATVVGQQIKRVFQEQTFPVVDGNDLGGGIKSVATSAGLSGLINVKPNDLATAQDTGVVFQYQPDPNNPGNYIWVSLPNIKSAQRTVSASTTITSYDRYIYYNANGGAIVQVLPNGSAFPDGTELLFCKIDITGNSVTFNPYGGQTILIPGNTVVLGVQGATLRIKWYAALSSWVVW